jgi:signal transduction histidine kinase
LRGWRTEGGASTELLRQQVLAELSREALSGDLPLVLDLTARRSCETIECERLEIRSAAAEGAGPLPQATWQAEGAPPLRFEEGLAASALETGALAFRESQGRWELALPIPGIDSAMGVIAAGGTGTPPDLQDTLFLRSVANVLAQAFERARVEGEMRRLHAELDRRVEERTAELSAVNHELEAFAYSVSHDLRAPLRWMDGFSRALVEDHGEGLPEQARDYLERIRRASQRMGGLIDELLALSRVTRVELKPREVDLAELARSVLAELRELEPEREVEEVIPPRLVVSGDPQLLRSLLENLLGNAWKFSRESRPARIEVGELPGEDERVFYVRDNGVGYDATYADQLFVPFQRLHPEAEFEGSGIGLANVQRIVRRHGGRVWGESETGQGATFYFTLARTRTE